MAGHVEKCKFTTQKCSWWFSTAHHCMYLECLYLIFSFISDTQFLRSKNGDRFFFTHKNEAGSFTRQGREILINRTLAGVICDNTDIAAVPEDAFALTDRNKFISCDDTPRLDLAEIIVLLWTGNSWLLQINFSRFRMKLNTHQKRLYTFFKKSLFNLGYEMKKLISLGKLPWLENIPIIVLSIEIDNIGSIRFIFFIMSIKNEFYSKF